MKWNRETQSGSEEDEDVLEDSDYADWSEEEGSEEEAGSWNDENVDWEREMEVMIKVEH